MLQPTLYSEYSEMQKIDAADVLDRFSGMLKWRSGGHILDIGCASGETLQSAILPRLPNNFSKLIAMDISEVMIEFARNQNKDPRISFVQMDAATKENIPGDLCCAFDHIISFNCLHWLQNQEQAFKNILHMLKPTGDLFAYFLAHHPVYDGYHAIAKSNKWKDYMEDFTEYVTPYQFVENPQEQVKTLLKATGFNCIFLHIDKKTYTYSSIDNSKKSMVAVMPFYGKIPEDKGDDFLEDFLQELRNLGCVQYNGNKCEEEWTMNEARLYSEYSDMQKRDAAAFLDRYLGVVQWRPGGGDAILDVGCASGESLRSILFPRLPDNFAKLVGLDISEKMVNFARRLNKDPRISFVQMDAATGEKIDADLYGIFDHVVSFYCLHWIQNQRQALRNILHMLKPDGDLLALFLVRHPIYDVYHALAKCNKWKNYMEGFTEYVSPHQFSKKPKEELEHLLDDVGLHTNLLRIEDKSFTFPSISNFKKSSIAVIPFYKKIPEDLREDFFHDYLEEHRNINCVKYNAIQCQEQVVWSYKLFILYGTKKNV